MLWEMWRNCYSTKDFHSLFPSHYKIHSFVYKTKHISTLCIICIQDRIMPSKRGVLPSLRLGGIPTGNKVQKWLQNAVPPSILCNVTLKFHFAFFFHQEVDYCPSPWIWAALWLVLANGMWQQHQRTTFRSLASILTLGTWSPGTK